MEIFEKMATALKIPFEKIPQQEKDNLSGEGFKQSVINAQEAYKKGDMNEFTKLNREELFIAKIQRGLQDMEQGRVISEEELDKAIEQW
jgi:hypothetical protein